MEKKVNSRSDSAHRILNYSKIDGKMTLLITLGRTMSWSEAGTNTGLCQDCHHSI